MTLCRTMACGLAVLLGQADIPHVFAGAGHAATPAVPLEAGTRITAANVLSFSVGDIEAEPGKDTPIAIKLPSPAELRDAGAEEGTFILMRNIPEGVSVSAGMATGRIWVVPLREVGALRLISEPGMNARFQIGFHLIGPGNRILAETKVSVALRPRETIAAISAAPPEAEVPTAAPPQLDAPRKPVRPQTQAPALPPEEEATLLARGKDVLQQGGIVAARLIFEELAKRGSAAGALALARSHDPAYVAPSAAPAPAPNMELALKWYERAAELGNPDAKRRLAEIVFGG